jgi:hypothetical protein
MQQLSRYKIRQKLILSKHNVENILQEILQSSQAEKCYCGKHHAVEKKKGKFKIIHIVLAYLNLNMTTKLPYHPPKSGERGLNKKN